MIENRRVKDIPITRRDEQRRRALVDLFGVDHVRNLIESDAPQNANGPETELAMSSLGGV